MDGKDWVMLSTVIVAVVALVVAISALRAVRKSAGHAGTSPSGLTPADRYAFVINPSKQGAAEMRQAVLKYFERYGLDEPAFFETTEVDPGHGQSLHALRDGATVVVAAGGDGTVRAVASALAGKDATMGLLPLGTGNLLARNIDIDVTSVERALTTLTTPVSRTIDIGRLKILEVPDRDDAATVDSEHVFLVIGGIGFDAAMVAATSAELKKRVGWIAYFMGGIKHLHTRRSTVRISLDDTKRFQTTLRTLLIGNCGKLPGGLSLIPDAVIDDGRLDIAAVDTRAGLAGWLQLFGEVVMQGFGIRSNAAKKVGRIDHTTAEKVTVDVISGSQQVQVDGDVLGHAHSIEAWVEPSVLRVRAPIQP